MLLEIKDCLMDLHEEDVSNMLAGREFGRVYPYAVNYVMEMLMIILNEKQDREPDRWAMHLRVCFGLTDVKDYDKSACYAEFMKKLNEYDYTTIDSKLLQSIQYEMNHFTSLRGGKFTSEVLEETHEVCATLGNWISVWYKAGKISFKIGTIEKDMAEKKAIADAEHERKME